MQHLKPSEILETLKKNAETKSSLSLGPMIILALLAGSFIALAGYGASVLNYKFIINPETLGIGRALGGVIFTSGLLMVILSGGELFTGNCLMVTAIPEKRISLSSMFKNWIVVYIGNLCGSIFIAYLINYTGLLNAGNGLLEKAVINTAVLKVGLDFGNAIILGTLCNFLVCIAVFMSTGADSTIGKVFTIFFPIWLFVTCGFEHSVANMYFIPVGIFADGGVTEGLTFSSFFLNNLLPVTIGNIIGGVIFVAGSYGLSYSKRK